MSQGRPGAITRAALVVAGLLAAAAVIAAIPFTAQRDALLEESDGALLGGMQPALRAFARPAAAPAAPPDVSGEAAGLRAIPLAATPFAEGGVRATKAGALDEARPLMQEALRRNPRSRSARTWLMVDSLRRGAYRSAVGHLDRLYLLDETMRPAVIAVLTTLASQRETMFEIARAMETHPIWRPAMFGQLNARHIDATILYRMLLEDKARPAFRSLDEQSQFIARLIDEGRYDYAYRVWLNLLPSAATYQSGYIYDPNFKGLPGARPFNWTFASEGDGSSEIGRGAGLRVSYSGESQTVLAQEAILLAPGRYALETQTGADTGGAADSAPLSWNVRCALPTREPIASLPVPRRAGAPARIAFAVPAGCAIQYVTLDGVPAEFPTAVETAIRHVAIRPAS